MQARLICALTLLILLASACSRPETAKMLARRLSKADRVIVLNHHDGITMTIRDEQLKKLVQAVEASQKIADGETLTATPSYTLVFFGPNFHLATVPTGGDVIFYVDKTPYEDKSGALMALREKFRQMHPTSR